MGNMRAKASELIERFVDDAISSGLTWDETVAVFGLAAKSLAYAAAAAGEAAVEDCIAHARKRLDEAFAQDVKVIVAEPAAPGAEARDNALLATARRRQTTKPH